jgi:hypothetical protein
MTVSNVAASGGLTNRVVGRILRRCALAAIGASLGAISASTFAADSSTGPSGLSTFPSQTMPASHRAARGSSPIPRWVSSPTTPGRSTGSTRS